jgi:hypothetical protein
MVNFPMGFLQSYLRLPRYQRVLLGLVGIGVGWYGPTFMNYLFLDDSQKNESGVKVSAADKAL